MRSLKWYSRLADVPGVDYPGWSGVDRSGVPLRGAKPRVRSYTVDGREQQSLEWSGSTSQSPASQHFNGDLSNVATPALLRNLAEALELPGEAQDYHFIIQNAGEELWRRRRAEPEVLEEIERVFWLDIRLIGACPDAVSDEYNEDRRFYEVRAFRSLVLLYRAEGAILEALDVARRAVRFDQQQQLLEEMEGRLAVLEAEDGVDAP